MSKKPRKTGKEKETAQSSVSIEKAQKVQDKNEERRIRQEEERKSRKRPRRFRKSWMQIDFSGGLTPICVVVDRMQA